MLVSSPTSALSAAAVLGAALLSARPALSFVVPPSPTAISSSGAATAFVVVDVDAPSSVARPASSSALRMSTPGAAQPVATTTTLALTLEKPLGLILEETEDGSGAVVVTAVNEGGSAYDCAEKDRLVNARIGKVMGADVSAAGFDDVMDAIVNAPSPFDIEFEAIAAAEDATEAEEGGEDAPAVPTYDVGTTVTITVQQPAETKKADITLEAKVGDNLRKTLLANGDIELYRGLKKKLGNCGGGGQCGFCAVELVDDEGVWGERSDYEAQRIGKNGGDKCRLACMNNIVGPATVRTL